MMWPTTGDLPAAAMPPFAKTESRWRIEDLPTDGKYHARTEMWMGRREVGKTATMSWKAAIRLLQMGPLGYKVWANYHLAFAERLDERLAEYMMAWPDDMNKKIICLDEARGVASSWKASTTANQLLGAQLEQIRKDDLEIMWATQFPQRVDKSVLFQVDYFVRPKLDPHTGIALMDIYDYWGQLTGNDYSRRSWPPRPGEQDLTLVAYGVNEIFPYYNTKQKIAPLWWGKGDGMAQVMPTTMNEPDTFDPDQEIPAGQEGREELRERGGSVRAKRAALWAMIAGLPDGWRPVTYLPDFQQLFPQIKNTRALITVLERAGWIVDGRPKAARRRE